MSVTPEGDIVTHSVESGYVMTSEHNHTPTTNGDTSSATLTLRLIMQGKEAGSIIGKKGDNVKKYREESGAKINISDSSCPERIVTVTGSTDQIFKAFTMICQKFEEDILNTHQNSSLPKPPVTVRLIVPASQCGSLIGKGGSKIKEIREVTGASVQVASEMLPNSTERAVTISGTADAITQCIYHICCVMVESPPKGATIPYRPKPSMPPVLFAGGQAFNMQPHQQYHAMPQPDPRAGMIQYAAIPQANCRMTTVPYRDEGVQVYNSLSKMAVQQGLLQPGVQLVGTQQALIPGMAPGQCHPQPPHNQGMSLGGAGMPGFARQPTQAAQQPPNATTHEMTIPNDLIGCIIGRGGAKINEIRQLSGATIKIANSEEGSSDRKVTITGTPDTINAAQYLINASLEMHKALTLADPSATPTSMTMTSSPAPLAAIPLAQYLKPMPLVGAGMGGMAIFDNLAMQKNFTTKIKGGLNLHAAAAAKTNGNKFTPY